jgi:hypothetical protein
MVNGLQRMPGHDHFRSGVRSELQVQPVDGRHERIGRSANEERGLRFFRTGERRRNGRNAGCGEQFTSAKIQA